MTDFLLDRQLQFSVLAGISASFLACADGRLYELEAGSNRKFSKKEPIFPIFKEIGTVPRIMKKDEILDFVFGKLYI